MEFLIEYVMVAPCMLTGPQIAPYGKGFEQILQQ